MRFVRHTHICSQIFVTASLPLACRSTPWNKQLASSACCAWRGSQASSRQCFPALEALRTSTNGCAVGYPEDAEELQAQHLGSTGLGSTRALKQRCGDAEGMEL